jgi:alpha-mannosidase
VFSYVMNNYWHTNYKADQEGPTTFRYSIRPHRGPHDPIGAARFGREASGPLLAVPADPAGNAETPPRLEVKSADAIVETLKPSEDGKALVLRLFGASGRTGKAALEFADPKPKELWLSNLAEDRIEKVAGEVEVPAWGIVTLRADLEGR